MSQAVNETVSSASEGRAEGRSGKAITGVPSRVRAKVWVPLAYQAGMGAYG